MKKLNSPLEWSTTFELLYTTEGIFEKEHIFDHLDSSIQLHRHDGPARIKPLIRGQLLEWWVHGKLHRTDGPAVIDYEEQLYFINGLQHSKQAFDETIQSVKELPPELKLTDPRWWVREWNGRR
jgi:hypothetical protein